MSKADLGYTIAYIGPKKIEFPPYMNNVCKGIDKKSLRKLIEKDSSNVLSIPAVNGALERNDGEEK